MTNYKMEFNVYSETIKYDYNIQIGSILRADRDIIKSYGVYFNNAYFSANIECKNLFVFLTTDSPMDISYFNSKLDKFRKIGYDLVNMVAIEANYDNMFMIVSPLVYELPKIGDKVLSEYIMNPENVIRHIKADLGLPESYQVRFVSKNRNIKSMVSDLGNIWGYSGKLKFESPIDLKGFGIGNPILQKNGYNTLVSMSNINS